jgi:hypothetical protein
MAWASEKFLALGMHWDELLTVLIENFVNSYKQI